MIATPFPWLSAIGMSLHAGFWEECLFRAIPLAGAAIIGNKYDSFTNDDIIEIIKLLYNQPNSSKSSGK